MSENSLRGFTGASARAAAISAAQAGDIEGSCKRIERDQLRIVGGRAGFEQIEAAFTGEGFSPHRHDTYGIGLTLTGVQSFNYRGESRASLPGNIIVLHPDELHDGAAGTESGLTYRMLYVAPDRIADALGQKGPLPFVANPVVDDPNFRNRLATALCQLEDEPSELAVDTIIAMVADGLTAHSDGRTMASTPGIAAAMRDCRALLLEDYVREIRSEELEQLTGLDRYTIARHFRRAYGTSPYRYVIMRRLDQARFLIRQGEALADVAVASGFADQAHLTRHFKQTYGMTPGRWSRLISAQQ